MKFELLKEDDAKYWRFAPASELFFLGGSCRDRTRRLSLLSPGPIAFPPGTELSYLQTRPQVYCSYLVVGSADFTGPVELERLVLLGGTVRFEGGGQVGNLMGNGHWIAPEGERKSLVLGRHDPNARLTNLTGNLIRDPTVVPSVIEEVALDEKFFAELRQTQEKLKDPKLDGRALVGLYQTVKYMSFRISTAWWETPPALRARCKKEVGRLFSEIIQKDPQLFMAGGAWRKLQTQSNNRGASHGSEGQSGIRQFRRPPLLRVSEGTSRCRVRRS
jgi:hypothetical protein